MSKRLIYAAFWTEELQALIEHLKQTNYNEKEIAHLEMILGEDVAHTI